MKVIVDVMGTCRNTVLEFSIRYMGQLWSTCIKRIYIGTFEIRRVEWNPQ